MSIEQPMIVIKGRSILRNEIDKFVNETILLTADRRRDRIPPHLVLKDRSSFILSKEEACEISKFMRDYPEDD